MASPTGLVWAIDLGDSSLKALRLAQSNGIVEVVDFEHIEHSKILSGKGVEDLERQEIIAISLRQFLENHLLDNDDVIISVPSQNSFARFVNLPPVEDKRIPEIIRFEAVQQIPFDIDEVQWDWQMMSDEGGGEKKVGIFAVKSDVINSFLEHFNREDIQVKLIQMAPMAIYNYAIYDRSDLAAAANDAAIVLLNIGAEHTDLVVCTKATVWQRSIPMGGNSFTKAISDAFKISFEKAEKLKRNAATSKYARQILQAMKPVFANYSSEIQRSIGFYSSSNPSTRLVKIAAMGGGTKMRGLLTYLQQSLRMPIERPDVFEKLALTEGLSAAKFHENVCDFGIVYGLAVQALGRAKIESNLLPKNIARSMVWTSKAKYFVAAACILLVASVLSFARVVFDKAAYRSKADVRKEITYIEQEGRRARSNLQEQKDRATVSESIIKEQIATFGYRDIVPKLMQTILANLPNEKNNPLQAELYKSFAAGDYEAVMKTDRKQRKQIFLASMNIRFAPDLEQATFDEKDIRTRTYDTTGGVPIAPTAPGMSEEAMMDLMKMRYGGGEGVVRPEDLWNQPEQVEEQAPVVPEVKMNAGFVVTIVGYSPDKDIEQLLDPPGVADRSDQWGFVTRLKNLKQLTDSNSFELLNISDPKNYKLEKAEVDLTNTTKPVPQGIGVLDQRTIKGSGAATPTYGGRFGGAYGAYSAGGTGRAEQILIDPMTREIISKCYKLNDDGSIMTDSRTGQIAYELNDKWFILRMKLRWNDAPQEIAGMLEKK